MTNPLAGRRRNIHHRRPPIPREIDDEDEYDGGRKVHPVFDNDEGGASAYFDPASLAASRSRWRYAVICDAGSSGTRIYVYRHRNRAETSILGTHGVMSDRRGVANGAEENRSKSKVERDVVVHVGKKVKPGLSSVARFFETRTGDSGTTAHLDPPSRKEMDISVSASEAATSYLLPGLLDALDAIPPEHRSTTPLYVFATGGMRLLTPGVQSDVYDGLAAGLTSERRLPLVVRRENIRTIDGEEEGYYAALAVNYLAGRLGSDLSCTTQASASPAAGRGLGSTTADGCNDESDDGGEGLRRIVDVDRRGDDGRGGSSDGDCERLRCNLLGALDLGGASTQIAFPVQSPLPPGDWPQRPWDAAARGEGGRFGPIQPRQRGGAFRKGAEGVSIQPRHSAASRRRPRQVGRSDFHVASLLGYGGDRIRSSLENYLARNALAATSRKQKLNPSQRHHRNVRGIYGSRGGDGDEGGSSGGGLTALEIANPCYFRGYRGSVSTTTIVEGHGRNDHVNNITHLHVGTGDADECRRMLGKVLLEIREGGIKRRGGGGGGHEGRYEGEGFGRPGDLLSLGAGAAAGAVANANSPVRIPSGSSFYALELYYYVFHFVRFAVERYVSLQTEHGRVIVGGGGGKSNVARLRSSHDGTAGGGPRAWNLERDLDLASVHGELSSSSNPSLPLLRSLAPVVCGWDYTFLVEQRDAYDDLTSPEKLPHRCLEFVYSLLLLEDTFGLGHNHDNGDDRGPVGGSKGGSVGGNVDVDVHFVDEVEGQGVEWTLGPFLHMLNWGNTGAWRGGASTVIDGNERVYADSHGNEWTTGVENWVRGVRIERTLAASALALLGLTYLSKRLKKRTENRKKWSHRRRASVILKRNDFQGLPRRPVRMIPPVEESDSSDSSCNENVLRGIPIPGVHKRRSR